MSYEEAYNTLLKNADKIANICGSYLPLDIILKYADAADKITNHIIRLSLESVKEIVRK